MPSLCRYTIVLVFSLSGLQRLFDVLLSHVDQQHAQGDVVALVMVVQPLPALLLIDREVYRGAELGVKGLRFGLQGWSVR